jgi:thiol-disulfide isomerase/thioredoxin
VKARSLLGLCLLSIACDQGGDAPAKSRVQAVLAEPSSRVEPHAEPASSAAAAGAGASAPAKPRPPLCDGQLDDKPAPFKPRTTPTRVARDAAPELPKDPLQHPSGRWTWINFWAAWCVPCKEELPVLFRWREALADRVEFRFVSLDDDERQLREFLAREPANGLTSTYWLPDGALRQGWLEALGLSSEPELPLQLLVDPKGLLRCRVEGAIEPSDLAALERLTGG